MSKVVTVMNMKGGVGKTTVTANLGGVIAHYQIHGTARKVLLIDYDPQFNLSQALIKSTTYFQLEKQKQTSLAILQDDETGLDPYTVQIPTHRAPPKVGTVAHRIKTFKDSYIDIVPSTIDLMYLAIGQPALRTDVFSVRFSKFIEECRGIYDVIFIDCHPAGSVLTMTSLRSSDFVLIPVAPQAYAIRGVGLMKRFIDGGLGAKAPQPVILFNAVPRSGLSDEESSIRGQPQFSKYCMTHTLKRYAAFQGPKEGEGWVWTSHKPYSTQAFHNLLAVSRELVTRCEL